MTIKEMLEKRANLVNEARGIFEKAKTEERDPTAEEREQFDKLMDEAAKLKSDADEAQAALEADTRRQSELEAAEKELKTSQGRKSAFEQASKPNNASGSQIVELADSVCGDKRAITVGGEHATDEYRQMFRSYLLGGPSALQGAETRALQKDIDSGGGFLSAPMQFMAELIKAVDNLTFMRGLARVLPPLTSADSIGAPSLDADPADPTWVAELSIGTEDSTMAFGKRELKPHPCAQFIKVSKTLLRRSAIGVDATVRDRLAYKMAVVLENAYLNGTGALQALGVFTASDNGISTDRDVSTGNTATSIMFDGLKECEYTLKAQYRRRAAWIFHRDGIKQISKLKDGEGRYIWTQSVVGGQPDRILNTPVYESEYAPNTFTTGLYVGILGDFSQYWIVDALTMTIQVLVELYAATNQNGYISRVETDGMPVLEEAFARVKLG